MKQEEQQKLWAKVLAKAWSDKAYKEKLLKHPAQALKEMGIELPTGQKIEVHEQSSKVVHLVLPQKPSGNLSETDLRKIAGGWGGSDAPCAGKDQVYGCQCK